MAKYHLTQKDRDLIGRTIKTVKGVGKGELPVPTRRRIVQGNASGSSTNLINLAVVLTEAGESEHETGGINFGTSGTAVLLDDDYLNSGTDPIEFKSLLRVPCPAGMIVELSSTEPITPGTTWDEQKVVGQLIEVRDYLAQLFDFGTLKILSTIGSDPDDIIWQGVCNTFVTDVQCVDGEIVLTTEDYIGIGCEA